MPHYITLMRWTSQGRMGLPAWRDRIEEGERTIAEAGGPALESSTWVMFLAPADTPRDIVERLSIATAKAVGDKDLKSRFDTIGIGPVGSAPEQARQFLEDEIAKWASVIRTANVKAE